MVSNIGERIQYLRGQNGMTQAYLAKRLGISRSAVNLWEMSQSVPSLANIIEMTKIFRVSADYILALDDRVTVDITDLGQDEKEAVFKIVNCLKNK